MSNLERVLFVNAEQATALFSGVAISVNGEEVTFNSGDLLLVPDDTDEQIAELREQISDMSSQQGL